MSDPMSTHPEGQILATITRRLRKAAEVLALAEMSGLPLPDSISINDHGVLEDLSFYCERPVFEQWADWLVAEREIGDKFEAATASTYLRDRGPVSLRFHADRSDR